MSPPACFSHTQSALCPSNCSDFQVIHPCPIRWCFAVLACFHLQHSTHWPDVDHTHTHIYSGSRYKEPRNLFFITQLKEMYVNVLQNMNITALLCIIKLYQVLIYGHIGAQILASCMTLFSFTTLCTSMSLRIWDPLQTAFESHWQQWQVLL
jgi:hypothetical protein